MYFSEQQLAVIKNYFADKPVLKGFVFGTFSRGEGGADSDLNLLVELDYTQPMGIQLYLHKLLKMQVDLVSARGISKYLKPIIEAQKKMIYAR